jgi:hypothetical protein
MKSLIFGNKIHDYDPLFLSKNEYTLLFFLLRKVNNSAFNPSNFSKNKLISEDSIPSRIYITDDNRVILLIKKDKRMLLFVDLFIYYNSYENNEPINESFIQAMDTKEYDYLYPISYPNQPDDMIEYKKFKRLQSEYDEEVSLKTQLINLNKFTYYFNRSSKDRLTNTEQVQRDYYRGKDYDIFQAVLSTLKYRLEAIQNNESKQFISYLEEWFPEIVSEEYGFTDPEIQSQLRHKDKLLNILFHSYTNGCSKYEKLLKLSIKYKKTKDPKFYRALVHLRDS